MRTYKLFDGYDEEFNLSSRSFANIQSVCKVMCECDFLSDQDVFHYAKIAGFQPEEVKGQKAYYFDKNWGKHNYLMALLPYLFQDAPTLWSVNKKPELKKKVIIGDTQISGEEAMNCFNAEEAYSALGFFLSCIGETLHDHSTFLNSLNLLQALQTSNGQTLGVGEE